MLFPITLDIGLLPSGDESENAADRIAVRAVIPRGDGRICLIRTSGGELKFPGGGSERGEDYTQTLVREVKEEAGLTVDPSSVPKPLMRIFQRTPDIFDRNKVFVMESLYYLCEIRDGEYDFGKQRLDDYEAELSFTPEYILPLRALAENELILLGGSWNSGDTRLSKWVYRDTVALRTLIEKKYI